MTSLRLQILFVMSCQVCVSLIFIFGYSSLSIRLDEAQSIWQTSGSLGTLIESLSKNVHVPLYHILVHYWQIFLGNELFYTRLLSLLFMLITIPIFFFGLKDIYGRHVAFLATGLLTLSPFIHWFVSETRMYTMVLFLTVLSQLTFLKLMRSPRSELWLLYVVVAILGMYTHYFFNLVLLSQIIFFFAFYRTCFTVVHLQRFILAGVLAFIGFLPWVYAVLQGAGTDADPSLTTPSSVDFFNVFSNFMFGFQVNLINSYILSLWPLLFILLVLGLCHKQRLKPETFFFLLSLFVPLLVAFMVSNFLQPVFLSRYLTVCLPALFIIVSVSLCHYSFNLRSKLFAVVCATCIISSMTQFLSPYTPVKEEFRAATLYVQDNAQTKDAFFVSAPFLIYPVLYYYKGVPILRTLPDWNRYSGEALDSSMTQEALDQSLDTYVNQGGKVYVLISYDQGDEIVLREHLFAKYKHVQSIQWSHDLELLIFES
jgi:hypothetical protein